MRTGAACCSRSSTRASASAAGCAGTTAGVNRSTAAASEPSQGARTRRRSPDRGRRRDRAQLSRPAAPRASACGSASSVPQKNVKSMRSKASGAMAWTKVISSPTWSNWPCTSSSSSSTKLAAARGDSDRASFNSRPTRVEAPAMAILYTGVLWFDWFDGGDHVSDSAALVRPRRARKEERARRSIASGGGATTSRPPAPRCRRTCRPAPRQKAPPGKT